MKIHYSLQSILLHGWIEDGDEDGDGDALNNSVFLILFGRDADTGQTEAGIQYLINQRAQTHSC